MNGTHVEKGISFFCWVRVCVKTTWYAIAEGRESNINFRHFETLTCPILKVSENGLSGLRHETKIEM